VRLTKHQLTASSSSLETLIRRVHFFLRVPSNSKVAYSARSNGTAEVANHRPSNLPFNYAVGITSTHTHRLADLLTRTDCQLLTTGFALKKM